MKRWFLFLILLVFSWGAQALPPDQYASLVLQKDLPRVLRWMGQLSQAQQRTQVEVYEFYRLALPETQPNHQLGISIRGSIERMVLFLEGSRYFEAASQTSPEFQAKKEKIVRLLQAAKDQLDRFQFGEDPQILLEQWSADWARLEGGDFGTFIIDVAEVFAELQKIILLPTGTPAPIVTPTPLAEPTPATSPGTTAGDAVTAVNAKILETSSEGSGEVVPTELVTDAPVLAPTPTASFEQQRFSSYVEAVEAGQVAPECQEAPFWQTDQSASCQKDDSLECDRSYARQCKKLQ